MRITVIVVCTIYIAGFVVLVGLFAQASVACADAADNSTSCIPLIFKDTTPPGCKKQVDVAQGISYYEGVFSAVVAVVFTMYALTFNSLAYALLTRDATFSNLTKLQRLLISNKVLRWIMSPCVPLHCPCAALCP
jgi:hypothetical protein